MRRKVIIAILAAAMALCAVACGDGDADKADAGGSAGAGTTEASAATTDDGASGATTDDGASGGTDGTVTDGAETDAGGKPEGPPIDRDRMGNPIALPESIETVVAIGPAINVILSGLGMLDKVVAADTYSYGVEGLDPALAIFDMMALDGERLINMAPDVILTTGMTRIYGEDQITMVSDAGICVVYIPVSESLEGIMDDIRFLAAVMGEPDRGAALVAGMESDIEAVRAIGLTVTEPRKVYFEIGSPPYLYSFGGGVFLDEMIGLIGAVNVLAHIDGWVQISEEAVVDANPDVILTNVNYNYYPADAAAEVADIMARPGWDALTAVADGAVHYIDTDSSSQPTQNVAKALMEMARAIYPELYS
ncbi:MAG: ABC transporter substrate-binding protein [Oscillospiraceae bacterium]|nr:ABC transporter substrate-binding protein [Oscillospiraceae bacterium]